MPRKVLKVNVIDPGNTMGEGEELDQEGMGGFPEDGEEFNAEEIDEGTDEGEPTKKVIAEPDPVAELRAQNEALQAQLADLSNRMPPPRHAEPEINPKDPFDDVDWDQELFNNPKGALKKAMELGGQKIAKQLKAEYTQDMNTRSFWSQFYATNPDLAEADDLVRSTLSANMTTLGGQPVPKAIENLGALTRSRIAGYIDKATKNRGKKATVEGSGLLPNSRPRQQQQEAAPLTLSALMKGRRAKRARAA